MYLIVHSIVIDENGDSWSIFWHDDYIISKTKITYKDVKFPYRVVLIQSSKKPEYYGAFREIIESQKSVNQALLKYQLLVNTQKAFIEDGATDNIAEFKNAFNRVTGVIELNSGGLQKVRVENLNREAMEQYQVIDNAFNRIQRVLGVNDSFLGQAFASDSGRKVKIQKDQSIMTLKYFTSSIETFYKFLGWDIVNLVKQYYTANQVLRIADDDTSYRWAELNRPLERPTGRIDPNTGQQEMELVLEEVIDPSTGELMQDDLGNYIVAPVPTGETDVTFTNVDIDIQSASFNDENEKNQLILETFLSGSIGQMLAQVSPADFFKIASLSIRSVQTKSAPEISDILERLSVSLNENPQNNQEASYMAQNLKGKGSAPSPLSQELKLPQNTNEGL